jgi:ABC-2 type transport system ATP-binding protein
MITANDVVFEYPGHRALDGVSFTVPEASITALVGPNGAGKTTLLRCLAALDEPLFGSIAIAGIDVRAEPRECHRQIGYLSDFFGLYDELPAHRCLEHIARLHDIGTKEVAAAVERSACLLQLESHLDKRARELSRGLRQRLAIAQAIIHRPRVLLLDEPASGLDPEARHELSALFRSLRDEGMTLLVSSHILAELDEYSSSMLILRDGKILDYRSLEQDENTQVLLEVEFSAPIEALADRLVESGGIEQLRVEGTTARFRFTGDQEAQSALLRGWIEAGLPVCAFGETRTNLQDVYRAEVQRESSSSSEEDGTS